MIASENTPAAISERLVVGAGIFHNLSDANSTLATVLLSLA